MHFQFYRRGFAMVVSLIILAAVIMSMVIAISTIDGQRKVDHLVRRKAQATETANALIDQIASTLEKIATKNLATLRSSEATLTNLTEMNEAFGIPNSLPSIGIKLNSTANTGLWVGDNLVYWSLQPVRVYDKVLATNSNHGVITASDVNSSDGSAYLNNSNVDPNTPPNLSVNAVGTEDAPPNTNLLFELVVDCFAVQKNDVATQNVNFNPYTAVGGEGHVQIRKMVSVSIKRLFEYVIFYNGTGPAGDLEICNGPVLTVSGAVHTNGALYAGGVSQPNSSASNYFDNANTGSGIYIGTSAAPSAVEGFDGIFRLRKVSNLHRTWFPLAASEAGYNFAIPTKLLDQARFDSLSYNGVSGGPNGASTFSGVPVRFNGQPFSSHDDSRLPDKTKRFLVIDPAGNYIKDRERGAKIKFIQEDLAGGLKSDRPLEPFLLVTNPVGGGPASSVNPSGASGWELQIPANAAQAPANELILYKNYGASTVSVLDHVLYQGALGTNKDYAALKASPSAAWNPPWDITLPAITAPSISEGCRPFSQTPTVKDAAVGATPAYNYNPPCITAPRASYPSDPNPSIAAGDSFSYDYFTNLSHPGIKGGLMPIMNSWMSNALGVGTAGKGGIAILERGVRNYTHHRARLATVIQAWATAANYNNSALSDDALDNLISAFQNAAAVTPTTPMTQVNWIGTGVAQANGIISDPTNWTGALSGGGVLDIAGRTAVYNFMTTAMPFTMGTMVPNYFDPTPNGEYPDRALFPSVVAQLQALALQGYCHAMRSHFVVYFGCDSYPRFNDITCQFLSIPQGGLIPSNLTVYLARTVAGRETGYARCHRYISTSQHINISVLALNVGSICSFIRFTPLNQLWATLDTTAMSSAFNGAIYITRTARLFGNTAGNAAPFLNRAPGIAADAPRQPWLTLENAQCNGFWNPMAPLGFNPVAAHTLQSGNLQILPDLFTAGLTTTHAAAFFGGLNQSSLGLGGNARAYTTWPVIGNNQLGTVNQIVAEDVNHRSYALPSASTNTRITEADSWTCYPTMPLRVRIENGSSVNWGGIIASAKSNTDQRMNGLTFYTPQVAYLRGDFNTVPDSAIDTTTGDPLYPPCSLYSDACAVLSNNYVDNLTNAAGSGSSMSNGTATTIRGNYTRGDASPATTYRLSFVIHNVPTDRENSIGKQYLETSELNNSQNGSGELENVLRYEENWGGSRVFNFFGSLVVFGRARYTRWNNDGYFGAPLRNYSYTNDLLTLEGQPPFAPFSVEVSTW